MSRAGEKHGGDSATVGRLLRHLAQPGASEASQFIVVRGIIRANVRSERKRSLAANSSAEICGWPSLPGRRCSQSNGLSRSSSITVCSLPSM